MGGASFLSGGDPIGGGGGFGFDGGDFSKKIIRWHPATSPAPAMGTAN